MKPGKPGRPTKAKGGQRLREAIQAIAQFERLELDWDVEMLANVLEISRQQTRALVATLSVRGKLAWREMHVRKRHLALTAEAKEITAQVA